MDAITRISCKEQIIKFNRNCPLSEVYVQRGGNSLKLLVFNLRPIQCKVGINAILRCLTGSQTVQQ